ncbi:hypothetical protein GOP47_0011921 [Adiantum capillus-veneris]|uniref:Pentatricopeptide repeat-containing protein n=1 Tax=Adiantum capillus-veneris TaxID=13818 RepID=A0A9D4UUW5_ADICA|nr:hypothetical protein GOP47_0011921 [Adiantum capillus-veneris]
MSKAAKPLLQRTIAFKTLFTSVPQRTRSWDLLNLNETLTILEDGFPSKPSVDVVARILHASRKLGNQQTTLRLYAYMLRMGMAIHPPLGNQLVSLLVEMGCTSNAQELFEKLAYRSASSWNSLISGYLKCGSLHSALALYQTMHMDSARPSVVNFVGLLKACAKLQDLDTGTRLHTHVAQLGLVDKDIFLGSILVDMYAKCGSMGQAQEVFDELPVQGVVAWTALIGGYVKDGCAKRALECYEQMLLSDLSPDVITFTCSLKACSSLSAIDKGQEIHAEMARRGFVGKDVLVGSSLVDMYTSCGFLVQAQEVFHKLPVKDVVSWTAMIAGYTRGGFSEKALECYGQMQFEGIPANSVTFACTLKACIYAGTLLKALEIHEEAIKRGLANTDQLVGNALVDMYANFGFLSKAREVLVSLRHRDVVSWNSLISGYVMHGHGKEALASHDQMQQEGISSDDVTFVCCLKACASLRAIQEGEKFHAEIARRGYYGSEHVAHVLVDMYAKGGSFVRAEEVIEELPYQDVVMWNSLISGQIKHGCLEEALYSLEQMQVQGISPDAISYVCGLKACGNLGLLEKGEHMHAEVSKQGSLDRDITIGNTLVDMYAKCGLLSKAQAVFDKLCSWDVIAWTSLIAGYAQIGGNEDVICGFDRMREEGLEPNLVTFVSVLNACSHAGLVNMGETYFDAMITEYGINPALEHFTCMVDLLGRAGQVEKAVSMIQHIPYHPDLVVWHTMLGACQQWGILELGRQAFKHAMPLDDMDAAAYIFMSNICADARSEGICS